jgi:hypothetical protein
MKIERDNIFVAFMTAAGLAVVAGLVVFLVLPSARDLSDLAHQIVAAETEVRAQYENRRNLLDVIASLKKAQVSVDELAGQFLPLGSELDFITSIEAIGERDGATVSIRLDPAPASPTNGGGDFGRVFSVIVTGPFAKAMQTVVDIERMPALISPSAISIRQSGVDVDGSSMISVTLHGQIANPPKDL